MSRVIRRSFAAAFISFALAVAVAAQRQQPDAATTRAPRVVSPPPTTPATNTQPDVDENFELNIAERRITERDFFASTSIEAGESSAHGLSLRVGVAVGASEIDVLLRNVQGRVRFRGSLEALQRVLDARRPATTARPDVP
ncbi:MAG: hypothetical protein LC803_12560 [Acidobacteria bacterium]|nr:hypothetical protein [Acidobacteriota bacterium]